MSKGIEHHLHTETVEKSQKFVKDIKLAGRGMKGETSSKKRKNKWHYVTDRNSPIGIATYNCINPLCIIVINRKR